MVTARFPALEYAPCDMLPLRAVAEQHGTRGSILAQDGTG